MQKCQNLPLIPPSTAGKIGLVMTMKEKKNSSEASKEARKHPDPITLAREFRLTGDATIRSDVEGSYTGITRNGERPVQDADDL